MIGAVINFLRRASRRLRAAAMASLFGGHGRAFRFDPDGSYSFSNIHVGDNVNLGTRPTMVAGRSVIRIGSNVMFGPEVLIVAGGHNQTVIGKFMIDVHEKTGDEDLGVVIEDDCWVGGRATLLRGVDVGRGSVIGANSVVTGCVPPYSVVVGNPAKVFRYRFSVDEAMRHEAAIYPLGQRLSRDELEHLNHAPKMRPRRRFPA